MQLTIINEDGSATMIDITQVSAGFAELIEQFARDPVTGTQSSSPSVDSPPSADSARRWCLTAGWSSSAARADGT